MYYCIDILICEVLTYSCSCLPRAYMHLCIFYKAKEKTVKENRTRDVAVQFDYLIPQSGIVHVYVVLDIMMCLHSFCFRFVRL